MSDGVLLKVDATFGSDNSDNINGITGYGSGQFTGVVGYGGASNGPGMIGIGGGSSGTGVIGITSNATNPATGANNGVYGRANAGGVSGVYGQNDAANGYGAAGRCDQAGGSGVLGTSASASGVGVYGHSSAGVGVYGVTFAANQYGVLGTTTATNSTAIAGIADQNGSSAFSGGTTNANAFAGVFQGTVVVQGNFAVTGSKSAVIQHPRTGDHRLVYCVESPESWFEDFGRDTLVGGKATVTMDADFAAIVHTDDYHVFLTEYGESNGLYVSAQSAAGFTVQERNKGTSGGRFSWRVVAKRADVKVERLGKFTMPTLPLPDVAKFTAPETPLAAPAPRKP